MPRPDYRFVAERFEVAFDGSTQSVPDLEALRPGMQVPAVVILETRSDKVQGWSYGLEPDGAFLTLRTSQWQGLQDLRSGPPSRSRWLRGCIHSLSIAWAGAYN